MVRVMYCTRELQHLSVLDDCLRVRHMLGDWWSMSPRPGPSSELMLDCSSALNEPVIAANHCGTRAVVREPRSNWHQKAIRTGPLRRTQSLFARRIADCTHAISFDKVSLQAHSNILLEETRHNRILG